MVFDLGAFVGDLTVEEDASRYVSFSFLHFIIYKKGKKEKKKKNMHHDIDNHVVVYSLHNMHVGRAVFSFSVIQKPAQQLCISITCVWILGGDVCRCELNCILQILVQLNMVC